MAAMKQASLLFESGASEEQNIPEVETETIEESVEGSGPRVYAVSELTQGIKQLFASRFADVWVSGEVSGFRPAASGHWYLQLKDERSVISTVMFKGVNRRLPFKIEEGMELVCRGKIDVFAKRGSYQLIVSHAEPKGMGALQLAFEQLKQQLQSEGLFEAQYKKRLPTVPRRIGVVTSPTGAVIRDILHVLARRFPGADVVLAPARVQGDGAAQEVADAIALLDAEYDCDVLIVGRGGGSIEDLWAFNEEAVARAIFYCATPIVSAVGHEIDFTIADFVADVRAPTPSAAAEIVVPDRTELLRNLRQRREQLQRGLKQWWRLRAQSLQDLRGRLRPPTHRFADWILQIDQQRERLHYSMNVGLRERTAMVEKLQSELHLLSPLAVLAKGYAVVTREGDAGVAVRSTQQLNSGDVLSIRFEDGAARVKVLA